MAKKKPAPKKAAPKKPAAKPKTAAGAKKKPTQAATSKAKSKTTKPASEKTSRSAKAASFAPKRVIKSSDDNQLHLLFKSDFECRQLFEYLRIRTVEELIEMGPREIIDRLSVPYMVAVERMRSRLADIQTCLAGDESFLQHHLEKRQQLSG